IKRAVHHGAAQHLPPKSTGGVAVGISASREYHGEFEQCFTNTNPHTPANSLYKHSAQDCAYAQWTRSAMIPQFNIIIATIIVLMPFTLQLQWEQHKNSTTCKQWSIQAPHTRTLTSHAHNIKKCL
ncbi:unnamed protein product, partial [Ceratitis capitata]